MTEELNFSIPDTTQRQGKPRSKLLPLLMTAVLIAVLANIGIGLVREHNRERKGPSAVLPSEQQKKLALKLEKQGLNTASAAAWKDYLANTALGAEDAARIWYRIGKLCQDENQYAMALESFYRSEGFSQPKDITSEVARHIQECLESMGKLAALRYDLTDRVGINAESTEGESGNAGNALVAEIGPHKIMKSDLDRIIEQRVDQQLSQLASYLPEDQVRQKKEEILKQSSTNKQREMFLNQYLIEEVLYRKARESRLADESRVKAALNSMERSLLASKLMEKELADAIKITPSDLETYYEAHKQEYIQPERAKISHILVSSSEKARDVRTKLGSGRDFSGLAAEFSQDDATRKNGGTLKEWINKNETGDIPGMGKPLNSEVNIFSTPAGQVIDRNVETDKGIHIIKVLKREPERQKTFDEVKNDVYVALRSHKEREVQQQLFTELKEQYDVVMHHSAFKEKSE